MRLSAEHLTDESAATGFRPEMLEKVIHLLSLLEALMRHPYLKARIALKGGTALNLFAFELPRLSVDIDLNYIGAPDLETMRAERPNVELAIVAVCGRQDLTVQRIPGDHAGGKWRLRYESALGQGGNLEVDLNFMYRVPLLPAVIRDSRRVGSHSASAITVLDEHELAAGKLCALLSRHAARDLFDAHQFLTRIAFDPGLLRLAFIAYGATNRTDWRTVSIDSVGFEARELRDMLIPVLRANHLESVDNVEAWAEQMVKETQTTLGAVLPFTDAEREFLDRILDHGQIEPSLLTDDNEMASRLKLHPGLLWKAQNVREFRGG